MVSGGSDVDRAMALLVAAGDVGSTFTGQAWPAIWYVLQSRASTRTLPRYWCLSVCDAVVSLAPFVFLVDACNMRADMYMY